jgi:hypothetical protein
MRTEGLLDRISGIPAAYSIRDDSRKTSREALGYTNLPPVTGELLSQQAGGPREPDWIVTGPNLPLLFDTGHGTLRLGEQNVRLMAIHKFL